MRKINVLEFVSLDGAYKPRAGPRNMPVAASRMAGGDYLGKKQQNQQNPAREQALKSIG
jgi:hypothetical protein